MSIPTNPTLEYFVFIIKKRSIYGTDTKWNIGIDSKYDIITKILSIYFNFTKYLNIARIDTVHPAFWKNNWLYWSTRIWFNDTIIFS